MKYNSDVSFKMMEKYSKKNGSNSESSNKEIENTSKDVLKYESTNSGYYNEYSKSKVNWGSVIVNALFFALCVMMAFLETESSFSSYDGELSVPLWKSLLVYVGAGIITKLVSGFFCYFTFDILDKKLDSMENKPPFSFRFVYGAIKLILFILLFALGVALFKGMVGI